MTRSTTVRLRGSRGTLGTRPYSGAHFVLDLVECSVAVLHAEASLPWDQARVIALRIGEAIATHWSGNKLHFPRATPSRGSVSWFRLDERNEQISCAYDGTNMDEMHQRYGLKNSAVHAIVARHRHARRNGSGSRAERGPELLHELRAHVNEILAARPGEVGRRSLDLAMDIAERMGHLHGGRRLWIPRPRQGASRLSWFVFTDRDRAAVAALQSGESPETVAARFTLAPSLLRALCARSELEDRAARLALGTQTRQEAPCATPST